MFTLKKYVEFMLVHMLWPVLHFLYGRLLLLTSINRFLILFKELISFEISHLKLTKEKIHKYKRKIYKFDA